MRWSDLGAVTEAAGLLGIAPPDGELTVHTRLSIADTPVTWWIDRAVHVVDDPVALAKAFAWLTDRWAQRHLIAALLDDPSAAGFLG